MIEAGLDLYSLVAGETVQIDLEEGLDREELNEGYPTTAYAGCRVHEAIPAANGKSLAAVR